MVAHVSFIASMLPPTASSGQAAVRMDRMGIESLTPRFPLQMEMGSDATENGCTRGHRPSPAGE